MKSKARVKKMGLLLLFICSVTLIATFALISHRNSQQKMRGEKALPVLELSNTDMLDFYKEHIHGTLQRLTFDLNYPIPEIQERYLVLARKAKKMGFKVRVSVEFTNWHNIHAPMASYTSKDEGRAVMLVFLPTMIDEYRSLNNDYPSTVASNLYHTQILVAAMHEMEHLGNDRTNLKTREALIEEEARAWDLTCRYTISILKEKYGYSLDPNTALYFDDWNRCGRTNSAEWLTTMYEVHKVLDAPRKK